VDVATDTNTSPEPIYESQQDWEQVQSVKHAGDGFVDIEGNDHEAGDQSSTRASLDWHIRFGHMPMSRLQAMASEGVLPQRLAKSQVPTCASCMYGKLTKRPWRHKKDNNHIESDTTVVGGCVSVDQMESHVPSFIAQIKGIPTRERYNVATIFVDHASDYTFLYLQNSTSSVHTLVAKKDFERHAASIGIKIQRYHADNGRFIDNIWMEHLREMNQSMSLCGVNAHHQNGKVEKRI
jgi:GAG-pre-integrase domain